MMSSEIFGDPFLSGFNSGQVFELHAPETWLSSPQDHVGDRPIGVQT